jgi:uncharacterized membrane protein YphA (DoxX/SURF4 family)
MTMDIASWSPRMLSVLRIVTGLLFLEHGTQKRVQGDLEVGVAVHLRPAGTRLRGCRPASVRF